MNKMNDSSSWRNQNSSQNESDTSSISSKLHLDQSNSDFNLTPPSVNQPSRSHPRPKNKSKVPSDNNTGWNNFKNQGVNQRRNKTEVTSKTQVDHSSSNLDLPHPAIATSQEKVMKHIRNEKFTIVVDETGYGKSIHFLKSLLNDTNSITIGRILWVLPDMYSIPSIVTMIKGEIGLLASQMIGYETYADKQISLETKIVFTSDSMLADKLLQQTNKGTAFETLFSGYSLVMVDGVQEMTLSQEKLLPMLRTTIEKREDLKLVLGSSGDEEHELEEYFQTKAVYIKGNYCVKTEYRPKAEDSQFSDSTAKKILHLYGLYKPKKGILVYIHDPWTLRDLKNRVERLLKKKEKYKTEVYQRKDFRVMIVIGSLTLAQYNYLAKDTNHVNIVLAVRMKDIFMTIKGFNVVVDTGCYKQNYYNNELQMNCLEYRRSSQSEANQIQRRAGQDEPGICIRLYLKSEFNQCPKRNDPEILRINPCQAALMIHEMGSLELIHKPNKKVTSKAEEYLEKIEAMRGGELTPKGDRMALLGLEPMLCETLFEGVNRGCQNEVANVISLINVNHKLQRPEFGKEENLPNLFTHEKGEIPVFLNVSKSWKKQTQENQEEWCETNFTSYPVMLEAENIAMRLHNILATIKWEGDDLKKEQTKIEVDEVETVVSQQADVEEEVTKCFLKAYIANVFHKTKIKSVGYKRLKNDFLSIAHYPSGQKPEYLLSLGLIKKSRLFIELNTAIKVEWLDEYRHNPDFSYLFTEYNLDGRYSLSNLSHLIVRDLEFKRSLAPDIEALIYKYDGNLQFDRKKGEIKM